MWLKFECWKDTVYIQSNTYIEIQSGLCNWFSCMSLNKCQILFLIYYTNLYCTRPQTHSNSNSLGVGNCVDCLVPGGTVGAGNRNTQYQRGLVPILRARRAVWQDGVRILCGKHARFNIECMNISSVSCPILQLACTHPPPK